MKKSIFRFLAALIAFSSMQSCVTNYVAANPTPANNGYKPSANIAQVQKKIDEDKQKLIASLISEELEKSKAMQMAVQTKLAVKKDAVAQHIDVILKEADSYLGTPYRFGGMTRSGIDCSAFVLSVFGAACGLQLPRVAAAQSQEGERVEKEDLKKGDLLFFSQGRGRISHVAIVYEVTEEGEVKFIHSATSKGVSYSSLNDSYWGRRYRFAKRVLTSDALASLQKTDAPVAAL